MTTNDRNPQQSANPSNNENPRQDAQPLPDCEADTAQSSNKVGLPELLRELAELAPEHVRAITSRPVGEYAVTPFWVRLAGAWQDVGVDDDERGLTLSAREEAVLQAGLQALCESRGWDWSVESALAHPDAERRACAQVWRPEAPRPADHWTTAHAPTAPVALAAATVQALRAERGA